MSLLLQDPWFNALIDDSMARIGRGLTHPQIKAFRKAMARTFETHPTARRILARSRPDLDRLLPPLDPEIHGYPPPPGKALS